MRPIFIIEYDYTDAHSSIKHITIIYRTNVSAICSDINREGLGDDISNTCSININVITNKEINSKFIRMIAYTLYFIRSIMLL